MCYARLARFTVTMIEENTFFFYKCCSYFTAFKIACAEYKDTNGEKVRTKRDKE